jgi:hypothetical protein
MAIILQLPQTFLGLWRHLLHLFRLSGGLKPQALRWILGRLAFTYSSLRTKFGLQKEMGKHPPSDQDDELRIPNARKDSTARSKHTEQAEISRLESGSTSYNLIEQGEILSLDDVAFSAYPFPGYIRATHPTHSLADSNQSAHNLATTINNASRSSQHLELEHSYHSRNSNYSGSVHSRGRTTAGPYLHRLTRDSPGWQQTTPIPHRQHTMSMPNLEVISPREDISPTGKVEVNSLRVPTKPVTPAFMLLGESRISPRMPEGFAGRRYDDRPRM